MYKPADDKLYWGPLWDFDMGWTFKVEGEEFEPKDAAGYWTIGFSWIDQLRKTDPYFVKLLKDRWGEMQPKLGDLTADNGIIDQFKKEITSDTSDIPADAGRSGRSSADAGRSGRSSADIGRSGGSNARVYAGNGEFRSPDSGDGAEPLLWIMIMAVMGMAVCVVRHVSVSRG